MTYLKHSPIFISDAFIREPKTRWPARHQTGAGRRADGHRDFSCLDTPGMKNTALAIALMTVVACTIAGGIFSSAASAEDPCEPYRQLIMRHYEELRVAYNHSVALAKQAADNLFSNPDLVATYLKDADRYRAEAERQRELYEATFKPGCG
jgi:hypothetical protein